MEEGAPISRLMVCIFKFIRLKKFRLQLSQLHHCRVQLFCEIIIFRAGSHHAADDVDMLPMRGNVPWGACFNSSENFGPPNLQLIWVLSPHFDPDVNTTKDNGYNSQVQYMISL